MTTVSEHKTSLPRGVDHLIWTVPDLRWGMSEIERRLGVRPVEGGRHPDYGTHNALAALGPETYLEIMAVDPDLPRPARGRLFAMDDLDEPRLAAWVLRCEEIDARVARAATGGVVLGPVASGSRERPDGSVVSWKISDPYAPRMGGVVPFLIAWGDTAHPARSAPAAGTLTGLRLEHPEPEAAQRALGLLGVGLAVDPGPRARLVATLQSAYGEVELR